MIAYRMISATSLQHKELIIFSETCLKAEECEGVEEIWTAHLCRVDAEAPLRPNAKRGPAQ